METSRTITVIQAVAILISTIVGVGVLSIPLFAVRAADTGAPLLTLLGIAVAAFGLFVLIALGVRFSNESIVQYGPRLVGKWLASIGTIAIIGFFLFLTALTAREFGEVVVTSVLKKTPLEITVIVMLFLAANSARRDMRTLSYIHLFYTPVILAPNLMIVMPSLKNANPLYLMPLMGNEPHGIFTGILTVAALFQVAFIMTIVIPHMRLPRKAVTAGAWAMLVSGSLYVLVVVATVAVFGPEETKMLLWPVLELAKTTSLPANILERLDAAFLAVWVTAVFTTLFSSYALTIHAASQLLKLRDHKMFAYFLMPFIVILAMLPQSVIQLYDIIEIAGRIGLTITIGYPLLLLLVALFRGKDKKGA